MTASSIALALSAGGARGAYQVGAMLFLAEAGITFSAVSGASIGALNGAYYAQSDGSVGYIEKLIEHWRTIPHMDILQVSEEAFIAGIKLLFSGDLSTVHSLTKGDYAILDPLPVAKLLDTWLDYEKICRSPIAMTVTVLSEVAPLFDVVTGTWRKARYLRARELRPEKLRQALLASAAIPFAFPSQALDKKKYADAGLVDPLPAQILYQDGALRIVSIFLSDSTIQNRADFSGSLVLQIRPSTPIDRGIGSTFDFSRQTIDRLIDLGYQDAQTTYKEAQDIFRLGVILREQGGRIQKLADELPERGRHILPSNEE